ncbi:hypothetical protein ACM66B_002935 [Microbotryomycetes sp. NB124-2]
MSDDPERGTSHDAAAAVQTSASLAGIATTMAPPSAVDQGALQFKFTKPTQSKQSGGTGRNGELQRNFQVTHGPVSQTFKGGRQDGGTKPFAQAQGGAVTVESHFRQAFQSSSTNLSGKPRFAKPPLHLMEPGPSKGQPISSPQPEVDMLGMQENTQASRDMQQPTMITDGGACGSANRLENSAVLLGLIAPITAQHARTDDHQPSPGLYDEHAVDSGGTHGHTIDQQAEAQDPSSEDQSNAQVSAKQPSLGKRARPSGNVGQSTHSMAASNKRHANGRGRPSSGAQHAGVEDESSARVMYMIQLERKIEKDRTLMVSMAEKLKHQKQEMQELNDSLIKLEDENASLKGEMRQKIATALRKHDEVEEEFKITFERVRQNAPGVEDDRSLAEVATELKAEVASLQAHINNCFYDHGRLNVEKTAEVKLQLLNELETKLKHAGEVLTLRNKELEQKTGIVVETKDRVAELEQALSSMQAAKIQSEQRIHELEDKLRHEIDHELTSAKDNRALLAVATDFEKKARETIKSLREENEQLKKSEHLLRVRLSTVESSVSNLEEQHAMLQGKLEQVEQRANDATQELFTFRQNAVTERHRLEGELILKRRRVDDLTKEVTELRPMKASVHALRQNLEEAERKLHGATLQLEASDEHLKKTKELNDEFIKNMQSRIESINKELDQTTKRSSNTQNEMNDAQARLKDLYARERELQTSEAGLRAELKQVKEKLAENDSGMSAAQVAALTAEKSKLETETESLTQQLRDATKESSRKSEEVAALAAARTELEQTLKQEQDQVTALRGQLENAERALKDLEGKQEIMLQQRSRQTYDDCQVQFRQEKSMITNELKRTKNRLDEVENRNQKLSIELGKTKELLKNAKQSNENDIGVQKTDAAQASKKHGEIGWQSESTDSAVSLSEISGLKGESECGDPSSDVLVPDTFVRQEPEQDRDEEAEETPVQAKHAYPTRRKSIQTFTAEVQPARSPVQGTSARELDEDPILDPAQSSPKTARPHKRSRTTYHSRKTK